MKPFLSHIAFFICCLILAHGQAMGQDGNRSIKYFNKAEDLYLEKSYDSAFLNYDIAKNFEEQKKRKAKPTTFFRMALQTSKDHC